MRTASEARDAALRPAASDRAFGAGTSRACATEAPLMRCAREAGVPEPEVYAVLEPDDGLGEGFVMEWLEGETLGARIVRSESLAAVRPRLAYQCGEVLARIHCDRSEGHRPRRLLEPMDAGAVRASRPGSATRRSTRRSR